MSSPPAIESEKTLEDGQEQAVSSSPIVPSEEKSEAIAIRPGRLKWILTLVGLCLSAFLFGLDTTIAADVQGSVYLALGHIEDLPWIGVGFPVGAVSVTLFAGRLFATFEIKKLLIGFITLFEIGSAVCGAAPTTKALIVGRVIAGIGGAGMFLGALTYVSVFATLREQPVYNAVIGFCWGIGAILGPVIGGGFSVSSATWRWAFYINLPLAGITSPIYLFILPQYNPLPESSLKLKCKLLDWAGAILHAATFSLFMISLVLSGPSLSWGSGGAIALWVMFGVSLVAYMLQQVFCVFTTPEHRLFPVEFLKRRTFVLVYIATASVAAAAAVPIYYVPIFFQFTRGDSAIEAAVRLLPFVTLYIASIMFNGALLPVFGRYMLWYLPAGIFATIGGVLMHRVDISTSTASIYGFEILIAVGGGLVFQTGYAILSAKSDPKDVPHSIGFVNVAQVGSIALSLSMAGSIFQNVGFDKLRVALAPYGLPDTALRNLLAGFQSNLPSAGHLEIERLAVEAVVETMSQVYILVITAGATTIVCAPLMRWEKLNLAPPADA